MSKTLIVLLALFAFGNIAAQGVHPGPLGSSTSIAVHKDSSIIHSWAQECLLERGFMDIKDSSLGKTSVGKAEMATGPAMSKGVVSLGDGGSATLTFEGILYNGSGPDFAVFENGFGNDFLELAFVEVSSDGKNFFRFPSISDTDTSSQIASFGTLSTSFIHNLAGKYPVGYGTPFDLDEMDNIAGLDIDNITHIRVIDVIGTMNDSLASRDSGGVKVNDPYPTPWPSGGFDLDAVAVFYIKPTGLKEEKTAHVRVYPNPVISVLTISDEMMVEFQLFDMKGRQVASGRNKKIDMEKLPAGFYLLNVNTENGSYPVKICKQ